MKLLNSFIHSFAIQIFLTHLKRNIWLLLVWVIVIMACFGKIGNVYGIKYLFLDPEYLGEVNFWSFFILGVTFGQLTMAFHMTTYILDSHRYPFLGGITHPFFKYSVNNSLIPFTVFVMYLVLIIRFQFHNEIRTPFMLIQYVLGFSLGTVLLLLFSFLYFRMTNRKGVQMMAKRVDTKLRRASLSRRRLMHKWSDYVRQQQKYVVHNFIDLRKGIVSTHLIPKVLNRESILKIFDQHHLNSVIIGISLIIALIILGGYIDTPILQIPAAASAMLFFTFVIILIGAISFWFRAWGIPFFIALFLAAELSNKWGINHHIFEAKGLNYSEKKAAYTLDELNTIHNQAAFSEDFNNTLAILEAWKKKQNSPKPKIIFLCVSGGGQRAALWTTGVMQKADRLLKGRLMDKTFMISGASGGMIGAAYFRELYLKSLTTPLNIQDPQHLINISKDNLNAVIFSLLVNDSFFSFREFEYQGKMYKKDRGYAFEDNFNKNIGYLFDKTLGEYAAYEKTAQIPFMLLTPTITNDGRKLFITSQSVSFLNIVEEKEKARSIRGVDFNRFFKNHEAQNLNFLTALRMSASFPYITPNISLPTKPRMEIMDAGIADNFGVSDALRFVYVFKEWIARNTSGVVLLIVRDTDPQEEIYGTESPSIVDRFTYPIASVYNNLTRIQNYNNNLKIKSAQKWLDTPLDCIEVIYGSDFSHSNIKRASLSWHLTSKEKSSILQSIYNPRNQKAFANLVEILE